MNPKTITEACDLGKSWGIDTAQTILAVAISEMLSKCKDDAEKITLMLELKDRFKEKCNQYKSINDI